MRARRAGLRRIQAGEYQTHDGRYRIIRGFADDRGWTVLRLMPGGNEFEVLTAGWPRLKDAREETRGR